MRACFLVWLCIASLGTFVPFARAELFSGSSPALRIVYTADGLGYLHPCPVCGGFATGGLARRASVLAEFAAKNIPTLILAGPGEFYADRGHQDASDTRILAGVQAKAFAAMPYAAVYLSAPAAAWLQKNKAATPASAVPLRDAPVSRSFVRGKLSIGVVFFPPAAGKGGTPTPGQTDAVLAAARDLAPTSALLIGVSPWGMQTENLLMRRFAGSFHILLGSGEGLGLPGQVTLPEQPLGPLWARAENMGRSVVVLDILSPPGRDPHFHWTEGINFSSREIPLSGAIIENPAVKSLMKDMPRDIE